MSNDIQIKHGKSIPIKGILAPYELGYATSNQTLYIGGWQNDELQDIKVSFAGVADLAAELQGTLPIEKGGTGATTADGALINLGALGKFAILNTTQNSFNGEQRFGYNDTPLSDYDLVSGLPCGFKTPAGFLKETFTGEICIPFGLENQILRVYKTNFTNDRLTKDEIASFSANSCSIKTNNFIFSSSDSNGSVIKIEYSDIETLSSTFSFEMAKNFFTGPSFSFNGTIGMSFNSPEISFEGTKGISFDYPKISFVHNYSIELNGTQSTGLTDLLAINEDGIIYNVTGGLTSLSGISPLTKRIKDLEDEKISVSHVELTITGNSSESIIRQGIPMAVFVTIKSSSITGIWTQGNYGYEQEMYGSVDGLTDNWPTKVGVTETSVNIIRMGTNDLTYNVTIIWKNDPNSNADSDVGKG